MNNTTIKEDKHGLFVRQNGSIYRPQLSVWSHPTGLAPLAPAGKSIHTVGTEVRVHPIVSTPFLKVTDRTRGREELWHAHGDYLDTSGRTIKSDECWKPKT